MNNNDSVDLLAYAGSTVKLRFEATLGNGFRSDMAIDDIQITITDLCPSVTEYTGTWDNGAPTINNPATISNNYNTTTNGGSLEVCAITIKNNATLTIGTGYYLKANGNITVDA